MPRASRARNWAFELRLTSSSSRIVTVQYELLDVDARAGLDYEGGSGELAFEPGQETVVLTVTTIEDDIDESDEVFQLLLSAPVNAELADANARGLIEDNGRPADAVHFGCHAGGGKAARFVFPWNSPRQAATK